MTATIMCVTPVQFEDKRKAGEFVEMFKLTLFSEVGMMEMYVRDNIYKEEDEVELKITVGRNYKPVVKIA